MTTTGVQRQKPLLTSIPKAPMPFKPRSITWLIQSLPTVEKLAWSHGKGHRLLNQTFLCLGQLFYFFEFIPFSIK